MGKGSGNGRRNSGNSTGSVSGGTTAGETLPTIGMATESFDHSNIKFTVFDMSGQSKYRNLWEVVLGDNEVPAVVFVLDSTDQLRLCVAKDELDMILSHPTFSCSSSSSS